MQPTDASPPVGTLRFLQWKQQRDRERRQQLPMAAPPVESPPQRRERRLPTHSEEEDELVGLLLEREWQEHVSRAASEQQAQPAGHVRRSTMPAQSEERRAERRPFGSDPRVKVPPAIQREEISRQYAFQPASSSRWRSMKRQETSSPEPLWLQDEADADRMLEQAAKTDDGERKDLWDNFYISSTKAGAIPQEPSPLDSARASIDPPPSVASRGFGSGTSTRTDKNSAGADAWSPHITDDVDKVIRRQRSSGSSRGNEKQKEDISESSSTVHEPVAEPRDTRAANSPSAVSPTPSSNPLLWTMLADQKRILSESLPPWSVRVLTGCIAIGIGGFFVEQLMEIAGIFSRSTPFTLSRAEQDRMHARLEGLQSELRGFRSAASEIDSHSQKVFQEVRHHLDRMRYERERHQDMVAKEMHELRRYILRMTYEMVEHEREVIHERLKEMVGVKVAEEIVNSQDEGSSTDYSDVNTTDASQSEPKNISETSRADLKAHDPSEARPFVDASVETTTKSAPVIDLPAEEDMAPVHVDVNSVEPSEIAVVADTLRPAVSIATPAKASKPVRPQTPVETRQMLLISWPIALALAVMIVFGAYIRLRLRSKNRRNRLLSGPTQQRQGQERQRFFSPSRRSTRAQGGQEDGWESAGSEYSVETVALMTPVNSEGEENEDERGGFRDDISEYYDDQSEHKSFASSVGSSQADDEDDMSEDDVHDSSSDDERRREMGEEWDRMEEEEDEEENNQGDPDNQEQEQEQTHRETVVDSPVVFRRESSPESDRAPVYRMATTERRFPFVTRADEPKAPEAASINRLKRRQFAMQYL